VCFLAKIQRHPSPETIERSKKMSEALFLINPKRRKKSRKGKMPAGLRRYWAAKRGRATNPKRRKKRHARRARAAAPVRRRKYRRSRALAPIRRKRRRNPIGRIRRRHHRRSNPFSIKGLTHTFMPAAIGATGAIALDVAYAYAMPYLPATLQTGYFATAVKLAGAIGLGFGARKLLGREKGNAVTLGALTVVGYGAIKPLIAQFAPSIKMAGLGGEENPFGYSPDQGIGFYSPASVIPGQGMGAYLAPQRGMGAYLAPGMSGLGGDYSAYQPDWSNDKM